MDRNKTMNDWIRGAVGRNLPTPQGQGQRQASQRQASQPGDWSETEIQDVSQTLGITRSAALDWLNQPKAKSAPPPPGNAGAGMANEPMDAGPGMNDIIRFLADRPRPKRW